ncbi:hypothetical protein PQQ86_37810 [Paraburkholderia sediminicola]|jgi:hypothetical protein|uniref:hypothetical protein n=1 Tax=Paraburkholderia sediminicola TaxID=458836 RepID=UPI0038B95248
MRNEYLSNRFEIIIFTACADKKALNFRRQAKSVRHLTEREVSPQYPHLAGSQSKTICRFCRFCGDPNYQLQKNFPFQRSFWSNRGTLYAFKLVQ